MNDSALACTEAKGASGEGWRWAMGCAICALAVGGLTAAIVLLPHAAEANRHNCMTAHAGDLHADLAAFSQDPAWQAEFIEALQACSR
jgi:hypothetical protein